MKINKVKYLAIFLIIIPLCMFFPPKIIFGHSSGPSDPIVPMKSVLLKLNSYKNPIGSQPLSPYDTGGCPLSFFSLNFGQLNFPPESSVRDNTKCQFASMRIRVYAQDVSDDILVSDQIATQFGSQSPFIQIQVPSDRVFELNVGLLTKQFAQGTCSFTTPGGGFGIGGCSVTNLPRKVRFDTIQKSYDGRTVGDIPLDFRVGTSQCGIGDCNTVRKYSLNNCY